MDIITYVIWYSIMVLIKKKKWNEKKLHKTIKQPLKDTYIN